MKDTIANLQAARDRLMPKVTACWGDAFDGDFDSMLEAINEMKRYHANIDADRAEFLQLAEQRAELLAMLQRLEKAGENMRNTVVESRGLRYMDAHDFALRDSRELIERIANATQQRNATGGEG